MTEETATDWRPFCGMVWPLAKTAGDPVVCTRMLHSDVEKHYNDELGIAWYQLEDEAG